MEAFVPTSTFFGTKPLSSRSHPLESRCNLRRNILCAKATPGPKSEPNESNVLRPKPQRTSSGGSSSFSGMAAGPGAPAKPTSFGSIGKKKPAPKSQGKPKEGSAAKSKPIQSADESSADPKPQETAADEQESSTRRAVRALGQKKNRPLPAIPKKTASDFIAEGVVDDVDDDLAQFEEADIRFGIADVMDPFKRDADQTEQLEQQAQAEQDMANVGKVFDVTGDSGVKKTLITPGTGDVADKGATVVVEYTGKLADGTTFDSSRNREDSFSFKLGAGKVIKGWEAGVATMRAGEVAEFIISPEYAYGRRGMPPVIPGSATLTFEIELLEFTGGEKNEIKKMADFNPDVARTPQDIAKEYNTLLETQEERKKGMSLLDRFYIISPFASQTGERPPWWLNPSITFVGVFALCGIAFYLVVLAGGIHVGYVDQPVDVNIFK